MKVPVLTLLFLRHLKTIICFQVAILFHLSIFSQVHQTEVLTSTEHLDMVSEMFQVNDSILVVTISNFPKPPISPAFALNEDSVICKIGLINLNTKQKKLIPLKGNLDSMELFLVGSYSINDTFYFLTRKISRNEPPNGAQTDSSSLFVYQVFSDTIEKVLTLHQNFESVDQNGFSFSNLNNNIIHVHTLPSNIFNDYRIAEYNLNGDIVEISDTLTGFMMKGVIQNPLDSTYQVFFRNRTSFKLDKNLQIIGQSFSLKEETTNRPFDVSYFRSRIAASPQFTGILKSSNIGDSVCVATMHLINDSLVVADWKKLVLYEPINSPTNYIYAQQQNESNFMQNYFFAYDRKICILGDPNCISTFKVVKHDTINNTVWELEFGGDAGYVVSNVLALKDSGCIVVVYRTAPGAYEYDAYYVHIDKNGNVTDNFLPILGNEELTIPVKETFSVYPNPTTGLLSIDNLQLTQQAKSIIVMDLSGKVVINQAFEKTINVSFLESGTYIYRLEDQNGKFYEIKFLKN